MNDNDKGRASWSEYSRLVLHKIDELSIDHKFLTKEVADLKLEMAKDLNKITSEIATLKTKAALWGSIGGSVFSAIIAFFIKYVTAK